MKRQLILTIIIFAACITLQAASLATHTFSTAGFYTIDDSPRTVVSMNPAWRFFKGAVEGAQSIDFDDSSWQVVSLPNGMETLPMEASGSINYRGEAWYRKHFVLDDSYANQRIVLYFEGIMGRSKIWVNGELVKEFFGGYLPISIDITDSCIVGGENLISVMADNSDDGLYPPGKPQATLDFTYFGGIYRDCWLYTTSTTYITDANMVDKVKGGGLHIDIVEASKSEATITVYSDISNLNRGVKRGAISYELIDNQGGIVASAESPITLKESTQFAKRLSVKSPNLWSPDSPYLYDLVVKVLSSSGAVLDGYATRVGIRTIDLDPKRGVVLSGEPLGRPLIGANRHQDFALVGNALSNSLHYRDAKLLKDAGIDIVRSAHYPQDPAFMEACDALGLFVIVATPGWQYWNEDPIFAQRVYSDIRQMVRRDRNHSSVIMWEPILNETHYPDDFAKIVHETVHEESFKSYTAADLSARGSQYFDVKYSGGIARDDERYDPNAIYFTREWGDNVDDWSAHNSPSRVARQWGEIPMLIQAKDYGRSRSNWASIDVLYESETNHIGGCLWHSFDHQRGYHTDTFYGGIMDVFRRPKYSYHLFQSKSHQTEPMVFIANLMTPFSPTDVTVYSNCDQVRLTTQVGEHIRTYDVPKDLGDNPFPIITFEDAFDFMRDKSYARAKKHGESYLLAEGLIDGKVVASHKVMPARRSTDLMLEVDTHDLAPVANGGDLVPVVAKVCDLNGVTKRLNNTSVRFEIEGEGRLISAHDIVPVIWGEACVLVQTTTNAGTIKVRAYTEYVGDNRINPAQIEFETIPSSVELLYDAKDESLTTAPSTTNGFTTYSQEGREKMIQSMGVVELQQSEFEVH